jgi:2-polyprenyl-3-methyl-5-hydroxy-6-metoxy-1,4-benzoquinol methylase
MTKRSLKGTAAWLVDLALPRGSKARETARAAAIRAGIHALPSTRKIPGGLLNREIAFSAAQQAELEESLRANYFNGFGAGYLETEHGQADLYDHLCGRLEKDRTKVIPWLESLRHLDGLRVLEIGCGTGASTLALAEQGAKVTGVDLDEPAMLVAKDRCRIGRVEARFIVANATEIREHVTRGEHDVIVFFAALEHMTHTERTTAIAEAWDLLSPGQLLVILEAPNRLWHFDTHSSSLPFFMWLPDDVASEYARYSPRQDYAECFDGSAPDPLLFHRKGRGVSFHDIVLALGIDAERLPVVGCLHEYLGTAHFSPLTRDGRYLRMIKSLAPDVASAFFYDYLDLALERS